MARVYFLPRSYTSYNAQIRPSESNRVSVTTINRNPVRRDECMSSVQYSKRIHFCNIKLVNSIASIENKIARQLPYWYSMDFVGRFTFLDCQLDGSKATLCTVMSSIWHPTTTLHK